MTAQKLIVSLTSFPARIGCVSTVIDSLKKQTLHPDAIILWLAESQFPQKEADLPEALRRQLSAGDFTLRWCEDLKPHKKYYHAFQEFPEDLVVTVDDDVIYPPEFLAKMTEAHRQWPGAIVAGRTHLITLDDQEQIKPYSHWLQRTMGFAEGPSMQLIAIGIGGVLYQPKLFPPDVLDSAAIRETCLMADDLWLKVMEAAAGLPVVHAELSDAIVTVPNSQQVSLSRDNMDQGGNDRQLAAICRWADAHIRKDLLIQAILKDTSGNTLRTFEDFCAWFNQDRTRYNALVSQKNNERLREKADAYTELNKKYTACKLEADQLRYCRDHPIRARLGALKRKLHSQSQKR